MKYSKSIFTMAVLAAIAFILGISSCMKESSHIREQENIESSDAMSSALSNLTF